MYVDTLGGTCTYMHIHVEIGVFFDYSPFYLLEQETCGVHHLLILANLTHQLAQGAKSLSLPLVLWDYNPIGSCQACLAFTWVLGIQTLVCTLAGQMLCSPSHLPNPPLHLLLPSSFHLLLINVCFSLSLFPCLQGPGLVSDFYILFPITLLHLARRALWLVVATISSLSLLLIPHSFAWMPFTVSLKGAQSTQLQNRNVLLCKQGCIALLDFLPFYWPS